MLTGLLLLQLQLSPPPFIPSEVEGFVEPATARSLDSPRGERSARLLYVADERVEENRRSIFVPIIFLAVGAGGTLTGAVLLYGGAVSALSGAGAGMVGAAATAFGLTLLTLGGVVVIVAVVFAVVGAIKLVRALRGGSSEPDRTYEVQTVEKGDRRLFQPTGPWKRRLSPFSGFVVARF